MLSHASAPPCKEQYLINGLTRIESFKDGKVNRMKDRLDVIGVEPQLGDIWSHHLVDEQGDFLPSALPGLFPQLLFLLLELLLPLLQAAHLRLKGIQPGRLCLPSIADLQVAEPPELPTAWADAEHPSKSLESLYGFHSDHLEGDSFVLDSISDEALVLVEAAQ